MQIKDISKQLNVSVRELLAFLKKRGERFLTENSRLSAELVGLLNQQYKPDGGKSFQHGLSADESIVVEDMSVGELASRLKASANSLIVQLLKTGIVASKNQLLKKEDVVKFLQSMNIDFAEKEQDPETELERLIEVKSSSGQELRLPVVSIVGHVDHGKTSLLDFLRSTKVAEKEKGGITQNVSAYEVATKYGNLVFLDTPGHEAFALMRERGVLIADLVVLIVALDDGVKPQTVESIKKIKELGATTVVALSKVDKVKSDRVDIVKRQLADYGLLPDDWGGDVPCVAVSSKTGVGIENLLEVIRLQADMLDLKTSLTEPAQGIVLESMIQRGRGAVATVILHKGKVCLSDYFVCGDTFGKVSSMTNCLAENLSCVGPSVPVLVAGFSALPKAGDLFEFATSAQVKKHKQKGKNVQARTKSQFVFHDAQFSVNVIIKAATHLSKEALLTSLEKLNVQEGQLKIVDSGIGDINEGNIELAATVGAVIYGLGVKTHRSALAKLSKPVDIRSFDIIYKLLEDVQELLDKQKVQKVEEKQVGQARVKAVFKIKAVGVIAGAAVEQGALQKDAKVKVYRDGTLLGGGVIKTLQKERITVTSIVAGNDCAFIVEGFSDWKLGDEVHCFVESTS